MSWKDQVKEFVARVMPQPMLEYSDPETGELHKVSAGLDEFGREIPDPVPVAIPVGMSANPTLRDLIRKMVAEQLFKQAVHEAGAETFEEADDFDIPDDPLDPSTPYEMEFEGLPIMQMRDKDGRLLPPDEVVQRIKEQYNGRSSVDQSRVDDDRGGAGQSDKKSKDQSEPQSDAADQGSVPKASGGSGAAKK